MISVNGEKKIVAGIIVECNPFHKGHIRLIKECKKKADIVVAVMSGNFVQRGEPAVYSKEKRVEEIIAKGVDLVIEMPLFATLSSAKYFARAGVSILDSLGFVDFIMFGSKVADVEKLSGLAKLAHTKSGIEKLVLMKSGIEKLAHTKVITTAETISSADNDEYDNIIKSELKAGRSYPYAVSKAMGILLTSNDILGVEYIRAINELKSKMKVMTIERKDDLPTASQLREGIRKKVTCNDFTEILNYKLMYAKAMADDKKENVLDDIYLMTEDMRNAIMKLEEQVRKDCLYEKRARIASLYEKGMSFEEMAMKLNTKNRTLANIKRIFFNIIFDIKKKDVLESGLAQLTLASGDFKVAVPTNDEQNQKKVSTKISFIKILGVNKGSKYILKSIKTPFLMSFAPSSYRSFVKRFKKSKAVKKNKSGGFTLASMIKKTILADMLYKNVSDKLKLLRRGLDFTNF